MAGNNNYSHRRRSKTQAWLGGRWNAADWLCPTIQTTNGKHSRRTSTHSFPTDWTCSHFFMCASTQKRKWELLPWCQIHQHKPACPLNHRGHIWTTVSLYLAHETKGAGWSEIAARAGLLVLYGACTTGATNPRRLCWYFCASISTWHSWKDIIIITSLGYCHLILKYLK